MPMCESVHIVTVRFFFAVELLLLLLSVVGVLFFSPFFFPQRVDSNNISCFFLTSLTSLLVLSLSFLSCPATESTNDRVKWFSVCEFILLLITNVWQIHTLRQFFEKRARI